MTVNGSVRLLVGLQRAEALIRDGIAPAYACSQVARKVEVDAAELALLWRQKREACDRARAALQRPDGYSSTKTTEADDAD